MINRSPILNWFIASLIFLAAAGGSLYTAVNGVLPDLVCRQNQTDRYLPLDDQSTFTQTVQPATANFASLTLYPQAAGDNPNNIFLLITGTDDPDTPLRVIRRPLNAIRYGKLVFRFPALPAGRAYQLNITTDAPPGTVFLAAADGDRYPPGSLHSADGTPLPNDLAFNTGYRPPLSSWPGMLLQTLPIVLPWLFFCILLTFIGLSLQFIVHPGNTPGTPLSVCVLQSIGLGLAFVILIGYTQSVLNIPLSTRSLLVWGSLLIMAMILRRVLGRSHAAHRLALPVPTGEDAALLLLFLFALVSRAVQTIGLEPVPLWVDGFNHVTKISFLAKGGILPLRINYPYGYHLLAWFAHLFTGLELPAAAFYTGFWISALAVPAAWPLARRIFSHRWAALLAVLLYGFLAPFPAYLATWSRFPFLLGLTLLPLALYAALDWLQSPRMKLASEAALAVPAAVLAASLALSHYGTIIHYAAFLPVILTTWRSWPENENLPAVRNQLLRLLSMALPAAAILLVKVFSLIQHREWKNALTAHQLDNQVIDLGYSLNLTTAHGGWLLWGLAFCGIGAAIFWKDRRKIAALAVGWLVALGLLNILQTILLGTPVSSWMNYIIALSMPLSWLAASALAGAADRLSTFFPKPKTRAWLPAILLTCLALSGFTGISGIINPVTILFTKQDREAMQWIKTQTPPDAVFYIDTFQWGTSISPSNGGGWIPALTGRGAVHPYINEQRENLQDFLTQRNVQYVYTHSSQPLADIPLFIHAEPVYRNETITIYTLPAAVASPEP